MEDINNYESAEMQEVAEPAEDVAESAEMQEVAEPAETETTNSSESTVQSNGRTEADAAFAEQRRTIQENEARIKELEESNHAMFEALSRYFNGETAEELSINANAYAEQRDPDEYRAEYEQQKELASLRADKESLEKQLIDFQVDRLMAEGLKEVQEIDPNIKSLDELGETFFHFISAGLSTREAYYATQVRDQNEKVFAPDAIGRVADTKAERDYYTSEELDHLTEQEMEDNWDKVMRSMNRL